MKVGDSELYDTYTILDTFSFQALNERPDRHSSICDESISRLGETSSVHGGSFLSDLDKSVTSNQSRFWSYYGHLPRKHVTRESEEVRVIKLYRHALHLCSSGIPEDELSAKPLLESIGGSFLLKSEKLPAQLHSIKFAAFKLLGAIYTKLNQNKKAIKVYLKAIDVDKNDLTVWIRLARISIKCARFNTATYALEYILNEHPCHPIALPLALPVYLALSEFEVCLELSVRALKLDPLDERAIYCVQYVLRLQPSLFFMIEDLVEQRPDLLSEAISDGIRAEMDAEVQRLRSVRREHLDAISELKNIKRVDFPEPLPGLIWSDLLEATVNMYDRLNLETTFAPVLNLTTLLPADVPPEEPISGEELDEETDVADLSSRSAEESPEVVQPEVVFSETSPNPVVTLTPLDDVPEHSVSSFDNEHDTASQHPSPEIDEPPENANTPIKQAVGTVAQPVIEENQDATEKRRSSRARGNVDLTDGINRWYRYKRGTNQESDYKQAATTKSCEARTLSRFQLADRVQALLPELFRQCAHQCLRNTDELPKSGVDEPLETRLVHSDSNTCFSVTDTDDQNIADQWSPETVVLFIRMMNEMQPNVITFGIALLLQVCGLNSRHWSPEMVNHYVDLSDRLHRCFPRCLMHPTELRSMRQVKSEDYPSLLPKDVLTFRCQPGLTTVTQLHVTYVELRLERLENELNRDQNGSRPGGTSYSPEKPREPVLDSQTIFTLLDAFSMYEPFSAEYLEVQAHFLWINYLLSSIISDFSEMRIYLDLLKEHLTENRLTINRMYSVHHGNLTPEYVDKMLNQLTSVSDFERLTRLSDDGHYTQVLTEAMEKLERRRVKLISQQNMYQLFSVINQRVFSSSAHICLLDRLALFGFCINQTLKKLKSAHEHSDNEDPPITEVTPSGCTNGTEDESTPRPTRLSILHLCYRASVYLLEASSIFCAKHGCPASSATNSPCGGPSHTPTKSTKETAHTLALDALDFIYKTWNLLANDGSRSVKSLNHSVDETSLTQISDAPLRFEAAGEAEDDEIPEDNVDVVDQNRTPMLTIGEACHTIVAILDFLTFHLRSSSEFAGPCTPLFSLRIISLVYEHFACIEQSIPPASLPVELRVLRQNAVNSNDPIPPELLPSLVSGSAMAPPSLAWLHWVHELLYLLFKTSGGSKTTNCRDRFEVLAILRQIITRTSRLLKKVSSNAMLRMSEMRSAKSSVSDLASDEQISSDPSSPRNSEDEFVDALPSDDDTIACVEDTQMNQKKYWPSGCISLKHMLAQAVRCLLPPTLFRGPSGQIQKLYVPELPDKDSNCSEGKVIVHKALPDWISAETGSGCVIPPWIEEVVGLLNRGYSYQHPSPSGSVKYAWWLISSSNSQTNDDETKLMDWECMETIFHLCRSVKMPTFDSLKALSISSEFLNLLLETFKIMPSSEKEKLVPVAQIESALQPKLKGVLGLPDNPVGLSCLTRLAFYLVADHYMKNNSFERAVEFYLQDLQAFPHRGDTWAALGLIYYSDLEQIINLTNLKTERVSPEAVSRCLRCFTVALTLFPNSVTLLIERGCLAYQLHSYSARALKKSEYRSFPEAHLNLCRKWRYRMLQLARSSYEQVLAFASARSPSVTSPSKTATVIGTSPNANPNPNSIQLPLPATPEEAKCSDQAAEECWLCHYMLSKCSEKEAYLTIPHQPNARGIAQQLLPLLRQYSGTLEALDAAGAKYPKKIIVYHKLPFRAVEAIEIYYKIHALALKTLLHYGPPKNLEAGTEVDQIPLEELLAFLNDLQSTEFVCGVGKPRRGKKRTSNAAGLSSKQTSSQPPKQLITAEYYRSCGIITEKSSETAVTHTTGANEPSDNAALSLTPPQEEFIDLTSPELAQSSPEEPKISAKDPEAIWRECVDCCRAAMELVLHRLPLHYKAMYRLADVYLRAPHIKNPSKALAILLGPLDETSKLTVGGLFKDRKQNNFFHGVWRIPTADIDRSGNFAAHMYRSVLLTLNVLHEQGDWRHLVHIFHQLRKQPPEEKRGFLGEGDRVFLARRAFNLIQPTLLTWLTQLSRSLSIYSVQTGERIGSDQDSTAVDAAGQPLGFINTETLTQIYRLHCVSYSRNTTVNSSPGPVLDSKEVISTTQNASTLAATEISGYSSVLQLAYHLCPSAWNMNGPNIPLQEILQRCTDLTSARSSSGGSGAGNTSSKPESARPSNAPTTGRGPT
ncbi:unnamed protein product [Calicophoron daubneyi]|uniref:Calcineurin-binding protein cabin-1 n=1 Tax=Calicophoron daubneyi TaxID=300641 RepID=A0AAV2TDP1_CALDB